MHKTPLEGYISAPVRAQSDSKDHKCSHLVETWDDEFWVLYNWLVTANDESELE